MSVLLTGGAGLIGTFASRELVSQGLRPITYDLTPRPMLTADLGDQVKHVAGNVCDLSRLLHVIREEDVDCIVHLASLLTYDAEMRPLEACRTNVEGVVSVLEAAWLSNIQRIIYFSSSSVYDLSAPTENDLFPEEHPFGPTNIYGSAKVCGELLMQDYALRRGMDVRIVRPQLVWGPGANPLSGGGQIVTPIVENPFFKKPVQIKKDTSYDLIYVKDVARFIHRLCEIDHVEHRAFNIAAGKRIELTDVANAVKKAIPGASITVRAGERDTLYAAADRAAGDITRAREELGFEPQYDVETAVRDYVDTLRMWSEQSA